MNTSPRILLSLGLVTATSLFGQLVSPEVGITWPTNGQVLASFTGVAGTAQATSAVERVDLVLRNLFTGQWWDGTNYQWSLVTLPATLSDTNWAPAPGLTWPVPCCGQSYELSATATDSETNIASTSIVVQADATPPFVTFAPLAHGQVVTNLADLAGQVTDNFNLVAAVVFNIHELDINGGPGRWWNGTNFQEVLVWLPGEVAANSWSPAAGLALPALNSGQSYVLTASATDANGNNASTNITVQVPITELVWDAGLTPLGTAVLENPNTNGGNYWFKIVPQSPSVGVWRTALNVLAGEANVYVSRDWQPNIFSYWYGSYRVGSDGFVLDASWFNPSENWFILVNASTNAEWNLVTGDAFVYDLGPLAADDTSGTNAAIGAEGMIFFQTTISADTLAWRLWLNGAPNQMYVRKSAAAHPANFGLTQAGQMLVVPPFLAGETFNGSYFIGVYGAPDTPIALDSRKHAVVDLAFDSLTNLVVATNEYPYRTFRVQVPVQQIAWQLNLTPTNGRPNLAVRRDLVPNEFRNDAFSETPTNVGASVTLVPPPPNSGPGVPGLSDGTFFVTVYSTGAFACAFSNSNPVITDVPYLFSITNDAPARAGWRYYRVANIGEQLGSLGWELLLANQAPGSEIALRRNAVPGRWNQRDNDNSYGFGTQGYVDSSGTGGFLQRPGHQADIWYIGVYTPDEALGEFELRGQLLTSHLTAFDGAGSSISVTNQTRDRWKFFRVDVPTNAIGWDVRLLNVTSGRPQLVVSRDTLPVNLNTQGPGGVGWYYPVNSTTWPSGYQWAAGQDWTRWTYSTDGTNEDGRVLAVGMGRPLEAGTYYIGVLTGSSWPPDLNPMSYTLTSRGIGDGLSLPVVDLAFTNGTATNTLAAREAAYYRVEIPADTPTWRLKLTATAGESLFAVLRATLPNMGCDLASCSWYCCSPMSVTAGTSPGKKLQKAGHDHLVLLPESGETNLLAGTYYVAVVSEGLNPQPPNAGNNWQNRIGSGGSEYVLESLGPSPVTDVGALGTNDLMQAGALEAGTVTAYQFEVQTNTAAIEVTLEDRVGNPVAMLAPGALWPALGCAYSDFYGLAGGTNGTRELSLITVANPTPGLFSLLVQAAHTNDVFGDASYTVRVRNVPPTPVAFDGGTSSVSNHIAGTWKFFRVDVPGNALGWDLRLISVTSGHPQLVVCRDSLPVNLNTQAPGGGGWYYPVSFTTWPGGYQWAAAQDWTRYTYSPDGTNEDGRMIAMGMGRPLETGTYFIGVLNDAGDATPANYTLTSRGIGDSMMLAVLDRPFELWSVTNSLPAREAAYYRIEIPSNAPSWRFKLTTTSGEALLAVLKDSVPNVGCDLATWNWYCHSPIPVTGPNSPGKKLQKAGNDHLVLLPEPGESNLVAGTYYLAVVSEGVNPQLPSVGNNWQSRLGSGSSDYVLASLGPLPILHLGALDTNDLVQSGALEAGTIAAYQFDVQSNTAAMEVRLENRLGNPVEILTPGARLPHLQGCGWWDHYGLTGGTNGVRDYSLLTVANPTPGSFSLLVQATHTSDFFSDASFTVRVRNVPPTPVDFDGGTTSVTGHVAGTWKFFRVDVPTNALGWDLRLLSVTSGWPQMVVCRDTLPVSLNTQGPGGSGWYYPISSTTWPSGYQWLAGQDWTRRSYSTDGTNENGRVLAMGMGRPLEAGTYFIGVLNQTAEATPMSYTVASRGIGDGLSLPVVPLAFDGGAATNLAAAREAAYYRVDIPSNTPSWKLKLHATEGETLLAVLKGAVPNVGCEIATWSWGCYYRLSASVGTSPGKKLQKAGDEHFVLLPEPGQSNLLAGTYYLAVVSEGINPQAPHAGNNWQDRIGTGSSEFVLASLGTLPVVDLGTSGTNDLAQAGALEAGEVAAYRFAVPSNALALEVRLEDRVGNPVELLTPGGLLPQVGGCAYNDWYGADAGVPASQRDFSLITLPNPAPGAYGLLVQASHSSDLFADASYTLRVRQPAIPELNFHSTLNTNGGTNVVWGQLADNQRAYLRLTVPATVEGAPVLGWKLDLTSLNGTPSVRVRKDVLPDDNYSGGSTPFSPLSLTVSPPYLSPGDWFVEVKGGGATTYSLTSTVLTTNTLDHALWVMPEPGQTSVTPGLTLPLIGDSGVDANGTPLPGDQGIDLEQGFMDYYAVLVPGTNAGLLRTELQAISGNPNLYLRVGSAPTLSHYRNGTYGDALYQRSLTGNTTEYGNWVPLSGRYETQLTPGVWVLAVHAAGNANVRYRLLVSCGNPATNDLVQDLALSGGSLANQNLNGGDWRYFRVQISDPAPANWEVTWTRSLGSARMFIRDTAPPGDGNRTSDYSDPNYNPPWPWWWWWNPDLMTWSSDGKNQGPYPRFDAPGTVSLTTPPLRPGHTYYVGFWSPNDTTFSVSSSTSGGPASVTNTIPFLGGSVSDVLPGYGSKVYRMDVPVDATRILFSSTNSTNVVLALEQGTLARPGGPAHWTSYPGNYNLNPNQANATLDVPLTTPNNWPWQPGHTYYLAVTNTSPDPEPVGVALAVPADLVPLQFLAPTAVSSPSPNPQIQVVLGVTNRGAATSAAQWADRVWLSTNGVLDASSIAIADFWQYQALPPGGEYWLTNQITLPLDRSGNYWLFLQVDGYHQIYEASLSNKVSAPVAGTFTLAPTDLSPVALWTPANVAVTWPDRAVPVVWCVTNQGLGEFPGSWYDRVWFSTNGVLDGQSFSVGDFYAGQSLSPAGSYWRTNLVTLPMNRSGGYSLFVQADVYGWVFETSEANNLIGPVPGNLTFTPPVFQEVTAGDGGITFTWGTIPGRAYQIQFASSLTPPVWWSNLTDVQIAPAESLSVTDAIGSNPRRFYRVLLLP